MTERTIKEDIDEGFKEFSLYTVYNRAIPSAIDGFKPGQRKIVYAMLQYPNNTKQKVKISDLGSISCVSGETIVNINGNNIMMADLAESFASGLKIKALDQKTDEIVSAEIIDVWKTKETTEIVEIELECGETLRVTPDHRILTDRGWVRADSLNESDQIISRHHN